MSSTIASIGTAVVSALPTATTDPNDVNYYSGPMPNLRFNCTMAAIFGVLVFCHAFIGAFTKQWWFFVCFICACILETIGYVGRALSHQDGGPQADYFIMQMVCLTIAPVFTMAGIYYQLAKLIEIYGQRYALLPTPMSYSYIFIVCDIVSLVIQAIGGGSSASAVRELKSTSTGDNVFVAGLAVQVASMTIFLGLWFHFLYEVYIKTRAEYLGISHWKWFQLFKVSRFDVDHLFREKYAMVREGHRWTFHYFNLALTAAVLFVYVRCIYRVAELAQGWNGFLISHEWYFIILDALMMSLATVVLTVFHPGFAFMGRSIEIPVTGSKKNQGENDNESKASLPESNAETHDVKGPVSDEKAGVLPRIFRRKK
ncbi:Rsb1 [Kluyveromyces lactis]|nr:Rsb1 [Kluyveromyces lactis]